MHTSPDISQGSKSPAFPVRGSSYYREEHKIYLLLSLAGALFGLISPGFDLFYLAWFGLVPLLVSTFSAKTIPQAFYRSVFFGYAYNLVYNNFILSFSASVWPDGLKPYTLIANTVVWLLVALQQGALYGTFASIIRWLPITGGFLPVRIQDRVRLPGLFIVPLAFVLIMNKLGNSPASVSVPWSLIEYSQYQQIQLLQIAGIIGGIGISALIVMTNMLVAGLIASFCRISALSDLAFPDKRSLVGSLIVVEILFVSIFIYGQDALSKGARRPLTNRTTISVLQGNMLFGLNEIDPKKHMDRYHELAAKSPTGICLWPEWSMPISIGLFPQAFRSLGDSARKKGQDWIVGAMDGKESSGFYNAAISLGISGDYLDNIYRKRYLVPFGEHTPPWLLKSPLGFACGTLTPRREGYIEGNEATVFELKEGKVAPLICCELISPELTAESVRNGGQLLVDLSNTMWFQTEQLGDQSIAVCAMRAVENHRYFVFGTSIGPSAFIDPFGRVTKRAPLNTACTLVDDVSFYNDLTPFTRWFR
ncbi:MAG: apolipoprotein N-acyltransferase [Candidatus Obscuribacterales bacterium]|nr:apolipoprotein N-acyltransferase [Candidatus Obscuribacterales bacterium]